MTDLPEPWLRTTTTEDGDRVVVAVGGDLDVATAPGFKAAVREARAAGVVFIDLAALEFVDSSGVHAIDELVRESGPDGLVIGDELQPAVRQVFQLTGLLGVLPIVSRP